MAKILIVDDTAINHISAQEQLANHELALTGSYTEAEWTIKDGAFDVVLTDMFMLAEAYNLNPLVWDRFRGQEMPVGYPLALMAASRGIPRVGVVSTTNHHLHPMALAMDWVTGYREPVVTTSAHRR